MIVPAARMGFEEFACRFCLRQEQAPSRLRVLLLSQLRCFQNDGWMLLEDCVPEPPARLTILPFGPKNLWQAVPDGAFHPHGHLWSVPVRVVGVLRTEDLR